MTPYSTLLVCGGVGYSLHIPKSSLQNISSNDPVEVFVYSHIKEDAFDLYGFLTEAEKQLFLKLISVDGIGPKTALGIMDRGVESIIRAVRSADVSFFSSVPRVGKKSAQKIIIELKNKLGGSEDLDLTEPTGKGAEIIEALVSLGFPESQSHKVLKTLDLETLKIEDAVKKAIQELTKKPVDQ